MHLLGLSVVGALVDHALATGSGWCRLSASAGNTGQVIWCMTRIKGGTCEAVTGARALHLTATVAATAQRCLHTQLCKFSRRFLSSGRLHTDRTDTSIAPSPLRNRPETRGGTLFSNGRAERSTRLCFTPPVYSNIAPIQALLIRHTSPKESFNVRHVHHATTYFRTAAVSATQCASRDRSWIVETK